MKKIIIVLIAAVTLVFSSCEDYLDKPSLTTMNDENYWTGENSLRLFANGFYNNYFVGYSNTWGVDYASLRGYTFSDDLTSAGKQGGFETQAPTSRASTSEAAAWLTTYAGPTWCFAWVRKSNLFIERVEMMKTDKLNADAYKHWSAVARFFRGYEYSRLVTVFGNVPYFDKVITDSELELMYKDRDDRTMVMDKVYDDFNYAFDNMRILDNNSAQYLNKYIAAAYISRLMLFEGTWQKYHLNNSEKAKKYLDLAVKAAQFVIDSKKYTFTSDYRSLFGSEDLSANKEVILFRQ